MGMDGTWSGLHWGGIAWAVFRGSLCYTMVDAYDQICLKNHQRISSNEQMAVVLNV